MENENDKIDIEIERERLELEKSRLELEKLKLESEIKPVIKNSQFEESNTDYNDYIKQLNWILICSILSIAGLCFFIIPGLVFSIITFIKLLTFYRPNSKNNTLRIIAAFSYWIFLFPGFICSLVFVSKEKKDISTNLKTD